MGKRKGAKYAAVERLNTLMATGQKRSEAKAEARLRGESCPGRGVRRMSPMPPRPTLRVLTRLPPETPKKPQPKTKTDSGRKRTEEPSVFLARNQARRRVWCSCHFNRMS